MDQFRIVGPTRISGRVSAGGAKNAALPELAATLLSDQPVRLDGVPRVRDLVTMRKLLAHLGQGPLFCLHGGQRQADVALITELDDQVPCLPGFRGDRRGCAPDCTLGPARSGPPPRPGSAPHRTPAHRDATGATTRPFGPRGSAGPH